MRKNRRLLILWATHNLAFMTGSLLQLWGAPEIDFGHEKVTYGGFALVEHKVNGDILAQHEDGRAYEFNCAWPGDNRVTITHADGSKSFDVPFQDLKSSFNLVATMEHYWCGPWDWDGF